MCILLSAVQSHLRLSSMTELTLKHLSLIALFLRKSLLWLRSLPSPALSLLWFYCQHHFLASSTTEFYCCYLFLSSSRSSSTADIIPFLLWHMLSTKSKFSINFIPIANHDRSKWVCIIFCINWVNIIICIHVHVSNEEINNKIMQNNANHKMGADDIKQIKNF